MAFESQGARFFWSNDTAVSSASTNLVGEVKSFSGPTGAAGVIDVSHLGSTAKEKLIGLPDEGQFTLSLNYSTSPANVRLRTDRSARNKRKWLLKLNDDSTTIIRGDGYCLNFPLTGGVDAALSQDITIEITGKTTWSTA